MNERIDRINVIVQFLEESQYFANNTPETPAKDIVNALTIWR